MTEPTYFFDRGLRFTCTECGRCCTGAPSLIRISEAEMQALAGHLELTRETLITNYLRPIEGGFSIREKGNGDCLFFDGNRCSIYAFRPHQCRTYPFWVRNLRSESAWARTCAACPGIGAGTFHSRERILHILGEELEIRRGTT